MTLLTIVSELELALQRNLLSEKIAVPKGKLIEQIKNKRASEIQRRFARSESVNMAWLSDMGIMETSRVKASEDSTFALVGTSFGKIVLPPVINLVNNPIIGDRGYFSVNSGDMRCRYYYTPEYSIYRMIDNKEYFSDSLFYHSGDSIYVYPSKDRVRLKLVLFDPLQGFIMDSALKNSGDLVVQDDYNEALVYKVVSGQVTHDGVLYNTGDTFTAVETTFTGPGKVTLATEKRRVTENDYYPMDSDLKDMVIRRILMEDYAVEKQLEADTSNDGKNENNQSNASKRVRSSEV